MNEIKIVIGSWGSYNECNERALGSKWLDLSTYSDWEEIEEELVKEGFELEGIDEELFIQDVEGINDNSVNWDYMHPQTLFETLYESEVLENDWKYEIFSAYLEVRSYDDFASLVRDKGSNWDNNIILYQGCSWDDYGREIFESYGYKIDSNIDNFFDFEGYGKYMGEDTVEEYSDGLIEIFY